MSTVYGFYSDKVSNFSYIQKNIILVLQNVTVRSNFNLFNLCRLKDNATDLTLYVIFLSLFSNCFSTSAFRNVHFLLDLCGAREDTHFPFFSADLQSFPLRYARTLRCYTALLFLLFRRHVSTNSF